MYDLIILLVLLALGYGFGQAAERRHFKSIFRREAALKNILVIPEKHLPEIYTKTEPRTQFVGGSVVVSVDYFKKFVSGLRAIVGGRMTSYESLFDRGRREAILRMKQEAKQLGAFAVFNVKLETASISKGKRDSIGCVEVYAYGTALIEK